MALLECTEMQSLSSLSLGTSSVTDGVPTDELALDMVKQMMEMVPPLAPPVETGTQWSAQQLVPGTWAPREPQLAADTPERHVSLPPGTRASCAGQLMSGILGSCAPPLAPDKHVAAARRPLSGTLARVAPSMPGTRSPVVRQLWSGTLESSELDIQVQTA